MEGTDTLKTSILIVDDTPDNLRVLAKILSRHGYEVRIADDGPGALESVQADPPDLILLDVMMPGMNGYEVCQRLKADEKTCHTPIIFLSALDQTEDKIKAFTAGGVDYITKPFQVEEVLARVKTHLALQSLTRRLEATLTERELLVKTLRQRAVELETRNEELDAYAHTVAHDIKGPVSIMLGFAEELEGAGLTMPGEALQEYLHSVARSGRKTVRIVDELLLLAEVRKIEDIELVPLDMAVIVAEARQRLADMIEGYQAEISLPERWPVAVGYVAWVEEVWVNYISNAIKYGGQPPHVELGFDEPSAGQSIAHSRIRFWVRDNGPGLALEEQARLFTPFTRLDQVRVKGHGLGLSIVRRIVEKLGGQVGVESAVGQGSTFSFALPAAEPASSQG